MSSNDSALDTPADQALDLAGFCGCGSWADAMEHILCVLRASKQPKPDFKWVQEFLGDGPNAQIVMYHLDHMGLTEHGSSVACAWTTKKGERLIDLLDDNPQIWEEI